jgi:hypothetical protein
MRRFLKGQSAQWVPLPPDELPLLCDLDTSEEVAALAREARAYAVG